jgi:hypothetical protein
MLFRFTYPTSSPHESCRRRKAAWSSLATWFKYAAKRAVLSGGSTQGWWSERLAFTAPMNSEASSTEGTERLTSTGEVSQAGLRGSQESGCGESSKACVSQEVARPGVSRRPLLSSRIRRFRTRGHETLRPAPSADSGGIRGGPSPLSAPPKQDPPVPVAPGHVLGGRIRR